MKCDPKDLLLYAVTDRHWLNGRTLVDVVKESMFPAICVRHCRFLIVFPFYCIIL